MTLTITETVEGKERVIAQFLFGEEKLSTTGKPNRFAGGKVVYQDKAYQVGCNMTQIVKK